MGVCFLGIGDCGSSTSTDISDITRNNIEINNSIKNNINQSCNMATTQENVINFIGANVDGLNASQKNQINNMCILQSILKSTTNADVVNNLMSKIKENLQSSGGLLGSGASNKSVIKRLQENSSKVDNSKFNEITKNCIMNTSQKNLINVIGSSVKNSKIDQANAAFLKCLSQHSDDTGISASVLNDTKNEADITSKAEGGDIGKSVGTAAKGIGEGVGTAAKGVGEGIGTAAEGVGGAVGSILGGLTTGPAIISGIILLILISISVASSMLR